MTIINGYTKLNYVKKSLEIALLLVCLGSFANLTKVLWQGSWLDFSVYYHSAAAAMAHINPYMLRGALVGFLYPPICLLLFYPFALLPYTIAGQLWAVISIICLIIASWLLLKMHDATKNRILLYATGILVFNYFPAKFTLGAGQINNIVFLLLVFALYANTRRRNFTTGALFGTSIMLKYYPLFIFPYLIIRRKWRILIGICATIVILLGISFLAISPQTTLYFLQHTLLSVSSTPLGNSYYYNQALSGFVAREFDTLATTQELTIYLGISLLILLASLWIILRRNAKTASDQNLEISVIIILCLLLNSFSWQHHFVVLLIPLFVTYFTLKQRKLSWHYYLVLAVCYVLTAINIKNPTGFPVILQSHMFYGALVLLIFDLYLLQKYQTTKRHKPKVAHTA
jgi:hypothetical protein